MQVQRESRQDASGDAVRRYNTKGHFESKLKVAVESEDYFAAAELQKTIAQFWRVFSSMPGCMALEVWCHSAGPRYKLNVDETNVDETNVDETIL